jgi:hypothetical protein
MITKKEKSNEEESANKKFMRQHILLLLQKQKQKLIKCFCSYDIGKGEVFVLFLLQVIVLQGSGLFE